MEERQFPMQDAQPEAGAKEENFNQAVLPNFESAVIPEQKSQSEQVDGSFTDEGSGLPEQNTMIRVKYNKQERTYSAEQAAPLVEMGLKWDSFRPQYEKLKYLASSQQKTVADLIDQIMEEDDSRLYRQIMDEVGGDQAEVARIFEMRKAERQKKFEQMCLNEAEKENLEQVEQQAEIENRLANDFLNLCDEFPDRFSNFSEIPAPVVETAVNENISLFDAYLRYQHREAMRVAEEQRRQSDSAARSAGSLGDVNLSFEFELDEFEQAFYNALQ